MKGSAEMNLPEMHDAAPKKIDRGRQDHGDHEQAAHHGVHRVEKGIAEEIERDVPSKERINETRGHAVQEQERLLPVLRTDRESQHERNQRRQKRNHFHQPVQVEMLQLRHALPERVHHA